MIRIRQAKVKDIISSQVEVTELLVEVEESDTVIEAIAINFNLLTGPVQVGDQVVLNTTAVHLGLGTGGKHFVMANHANVAVDTTQAGHIMKLRYTPLQVKCLAVEEASPNRSEIEKFTDLKRMPVLVGSLHSQLPGAAVGVKKVSGGKLRIGYVMTDGAALPLPLSRLVRELKAQGLIDFTVTVGHAFGGDLEAVNIYSGLIAAREVGRADVIIVAMGPGIVGTGTKYGFTGIEQGDILNAVNALGGSAVCIPRISFADPRERHTGLSHHTLTVLEKIAVTPCMVALPKLDGSKGHFLRQQLSQRGITSKHALEELPADDILEAMVNQYQIKVSTMGRSIAEDREFFLASCAAGKLAAGLLIY